MAWRTLLVRQVPWYGETVEPLALFGNVVMIVASGLAIVPKACFQWWQTNA